MANQRVRFTFPTRLIPEPIIWELGHSYPIVTNIRRAQVKRRLVGSCWSLRGTRARLAKAWTGYGPRASAWTLWWGTSSKASGKSGPSLPGRRCILRSLFPCCCSATIGMLHDSKSETRQDRSGWSAGTGAKEATE